MSINQKPGFDRQAASLIIVLAIFSSIAYIFKFYTFTLDDAFISFRYALNLAHGNGLVFNVDELPRAEGITSPIYAAILALFAYSGFDLYTSAKIFGIVCMFSVMVVLFKFSLMLTSRLEEKSSFKYTFSSLTLFYYAVDPYVISNSLTAMETVLGVLLFISFLYWNSKVILTGKFENSDVFILGLLSVLTPLVRPELALSVIVLHIINLVFFKEHRKKFIYAFVFFILFGSLYFLWRYFYYEQILPLPFYIKQGGTGLRGLAEVIQFLSHYAWFVLLSISGLILIKKENRLLLKVLYSLCFVFCIQLLYYFSIRHIMGFGFRYFQPIFPIVILFAGMGSALIYKSLCGYIKHKYGAFIMTSVFMLAAVLIGLYGSIKTNVYVPLLTEGIARTSAVSNTFALASKKYTVAMNDCGVFPYITMWKIVDLAGLNNRNIALMRSKETSIEEIIKNDTDFVFLAAKGNNGKLRGYENLQKSDIEEIGYRYLGGIRAFKDYYWLVYGRNDRDYPILIRDLKQKNMINMKE